MSVVGTTEAAFLLNISTARLRLLLGQGRVNGAQKVKRFWLIPLNSQGVPEITSGRRGPQGSWNKGKRTGNTYIHVLRRAIDYNRDNGTSFFWEWGMVHGELGRESFYKYGMHPKDLITNLISILLLAGANAPRVADATSPPEFDGFSRYNKPS